MKIKTSQLSKESLIVIADAARQTNVIPEGLILDFYKRDLASQINAIRRQLEKNKGKNKEQEAVP